MAVYSSMYTACRGCSCLLIIVFLLAAWATATQFTTGKFDTQWLGWVLAAIFVSIILLVDCLFDDNQFVFDPKFEHWMAKTGNDKVV